MLVEFMKPRGSSADHCGPFLRTAVETLSEDALAEEGAGRKSE